jgi:KUP system potassium uptake protein
LQDITPCYNFVAVSWDCVGNLFLFTGHNNSMVPSSQPTPSTSSSYTKPDAAQATVAHTSNGHEHHHALTAAGVLVTLGIVFGDIGTCPLYVMKAIVGNAPISEALVYGGISCVFWTLMIIATFKYVYLALNMDNRGEGGIFALYALVRRYKSPWVIFPALVGCASLMADGFITPPISISSAIEGLQQLYPDIQTIPIVVIILIVLFSIQQFGTTIVGSAFGPIMFVWFAMIGGLGIIEILKYPSILTAINPVYAIRLLAQYPGGFWLLGSVFLCTTGGEALYSDLGHCGKSNIRASWILVCACLLLNYFGQGAWLMTHHNGQVLPDSVKNIGVLYAMVPAAYLKYAIIVATAATIIASQALITGCFTLVNEAMKLKLWINLKVNYPTQLKGQIYIPAINWFLLAGCLLVVWIFKKSSNMEAAYGLAIIFHMLMTSSLMIFYRWMRSKSKNAQHATQSKILTIVMGVVLVSIELMFLISNAEKFPHGGWFSVLVAIVLFGMIFVFYQGKQLRKVHTNFVSLDEYVPMLTDLMADESIPKEATNLVYMTMADNKSKIDKNIVYSIFRKRPKRADIYWFVHVDIMDIPTGQSYKVDTLIPGKAFFVRLKFGFKVEHKVNRMFKKIVEEMQANGEVDETSHYPSLKKYNIPADFKFILLNSRVSTDDELSPYEQWIVRVYRVIKKLSLSTAEDFGLEVGNVEVETVPINIAPLKDFQMKRE